MKSPLAAFSQMNAIVKIALLLVLVLVVIGVFYFVFGVTGGALIALIIGLVVVFIIFMIFLAFLRMMRKRKAAPFEGAIAGNTGAVPSNISEVSSRARMDDLRQKFLKGIEAFRTHGKDIYSLPWYAIVGEPGSGKTEALRHSNIGFPPGLQDELQGSGGTINMDWWFTNHAIILDTAGRLMFDEASTESNPEWVEFLKLLAKHRPNCPMNGLMLVIPADSIIRDNADQIQDKGSRIAHQLDLIQRTLGVRFPVFILITKSDLVNGFREFFDQLNDPQLQHQIMGWSNPRGLDEEFNPEDVVDHIYNVQERLERRRMGLMLDPVSREGVMSKRLDEVDALFAFPESLANITPRLRRYLELIFVSGEWSSKPLFLRGIYFVSSMREGSALDADLAEAFGVNIDELPEGRIWERDRSYFLRDLFLMKMFRERGLVTRTSNTSKLKRKRGLVLLTTGIAASILLIGLTWLYARDLRRSILQPFEFWSAAANIYTQPENVDTYPAIVGGQQIRSADDDLVYLGDLPADISNRLQDQGNALTIASAVAAVDGHVTRPITVPLILRPVALFSSSSSSNLFEAERKEAGRAIFEFSILRPLLRRTLLSIGASTDADPWSPLASEALVAIMRLYALNSDAVERPTGINLTPIFAYVLRPEATDSGDDQSFQLASVDLADIQKTFDQLYIQLDSSDTWPGRTVLLPDIDTHQVITTGITHIDRFVQNKWRGGGTDNLSNAIGFLLAMNQFDEIEKRIVTAYNPAASPQGDLTLWDELYPDLGITPVDGAGRPTGPYQVITDLSPNLEDQGLSAWYTQIIDTARSETLDQHQAMIAMLPQDPQPTPENEEAQTPTGPIHRNLLTYRRQLESQLEQLNTQLAVQPDEAELTSLESRLLALNQRTNQPEYRSRGEVFANIERLRRKTRSAPDLPGLALTLVEQDAEILQQQQEFDAQRSPTAEDDINRVLDAAGHLLGLVRSSSSNVLIDDVIGKTSAPETARQVGERVREIVNRSATIDSTEAPNLEMTVWRDGNAFLDDQFHMQAGPICVNMLAEIETSLRNRSRLLPLAESLKDTRHDYLQQYIAYWRSVLPDTRLFESFEGDWSRFRGSLDFNRSTLNIKLRSLAETRRDALRAITQHTDWPKALTDSMTQATDWIAADISMLNDQDNFELLSESWWRSWRRDRSGDFDFDRQNILLFDKPDFTNGPLALYGIDPNDHYIDYWRNLTIVGLEVLALASENITRDAEQTLNQLQSFPLTRLDKEASLDRLGQDNSFQHQQLNWDQVLEARAALNKIRPRNALSDDPNSMEFEGTAIGNPDTKYQVLIIDEALRKLRGKRLGVTEMQRFNNLSTLLQAFPSNPTDPPLRCSIKYLRNKPPTGNRSNISLTMGIVRVDCREPAEPNRRYRINLGSVVDFGVEMYPGSEQLIFSFSKTDGAPIDLTYSVNNPWAVLALLHKHGGQRVATDPDMKTWEVEVIVPHDGTDWSFWLELKFDTTFPALDEWPE